MTADDQGRQNVEIRSAKVGAIHRCIGVSSSFFCNSLQVYSGLDGNLSRLSRIELKNNGWDAERALVGSSGTEKSSLGSSGLFLERLRAFPIGSNQETFRKSRRAPYHPFDPYGYGA
jgi:hypothetical protein